MIVSVMISTIRDQSSVDVLFDVFSEEKKIYNQNNEYNFFKQTMI